MSSQRVYMFHIELGMGSHGRVIGVDSKWLPGRNRAAVYMLFHTCGLECSVRASVHTYVGRVMGVDSEWLPGHQEA